jgi:hypothetical protein
MEEGQRRGVQRKNHLRYFRIALTIPTLQIENKINPTFAQRGHSRGKYHLSTDNLPKQCRRTLINMPYYQTLL